jgi:Recombinase
LDLLDHGINVATLVDRRTYTPDSGDQMDLMLSIALMVRAHDESLHKSDRLTAVWSNKRKNARSKPMTNRCKAWLRPRADRSGFDAIPERTDVIKRIFCESADFGIGADAIARRFNKEGLTTFGSSNGWYKSYILKILMDRAVLGEFQPHRVTTNGREPVGEPLVDYYPKIIDEDLFYRAQTGLGRRRIAGGGRKGLRVSNLFSKVAKCGLCGARMSFVNKGGPNGKALICDAARRGLGCHPIPWRYEEFERSFLTFIKELDLASLTGSAETKTDLNQTRDRVRELEGRLATAEHQRDRVFELILGNEATDFLAEKLRQHDQEVSDFGAEIDATRARLNQLEHQAAAFSAESEKLTAVIDRLQSENSLEMFRARSAVSARLASIIDELLVWPGGAPPSAEAHRLAEHHASNACEKDSSSLSDYLAPMDKAHRAFCVRLKDGSVRFVGLRPDAPGSFRFLADSTGILLSEGSFNAYCQSRYGKRLATGPEYSRALEVILSDPGSFARYDGAVQGR